MNYDGVIIVTGSSGRIGSSVVKRLGKKYRIVGFELLKAMYASANEELVPVDIGSDESVAQAFMHIRNFYDNKITAVIHLAAYYSFDQKFSPQYDAITVRGTERLLKQLKSFEVEQFIFSSSMLIHAPCLPGETINEDWPLQEKWGYPESKVKTEKLIHKEHGNIPTLILRIAGVYDDMCHSIPISHQIQRIYEKRLESHLFSGDVTHGASFIHMDDLIDAIEIAVERRKTLPDDLTLLLGESKTLSYDEMQRMIARILWGKEFKTYQIPKWFAKIGAAVEGIFHNSFIKPWMIDIADDHYALDVSRARKFLGWEPKRSLEETLPKMIQALKSDPAKWYRENHLS